MLATDLHAVVKRFATLRTIVEEDLLDQDASCYVKLKDGQLCQILMLEALGLRFGRMWYTATVYNTETSIVEEPWIVEEGRLVTVVREEGL